MQLAHGRARFNRTHRPAVKDARPSVAVLPFENRSREADDAFFVDGIHDDILTQLSKVSALRVIRAPPSNVFASRS